MLSRGSFRKRTLRVGGTCAKGGEMEQLPPGERGGLEKVGKSQI